MKHTCLITLLALSSALMAQEQPEAPIVFRGETLALNKEFTRTQCGETPLEMPEVSGMSCSRVTPGYLWIMSDDNYRVEAIDPQGNVYMCVTLKNKPKRDDWEGITTGCYQGKNYIFVGAFGDNGFRRDKYYLFYFEEPTIPAKRKNVTHWVGKQYIQYLYPDGKSHNTEAVMYDNVDNILYIVDKIDHNINHVYSLRMDTIYGTDIQILKYECDLGFEGEDQFQRVTAADISWDGQWIIIKNNDVFREKAYSLIWHRQPGESVIDAIQRQPQQIEAYLTEWQGEAVAWEDNNTFYTTSDDDNRAPIYKYVRTEPSGLEDVTDMPAYGSVQKMLIDGQLMIIRNGETYNVQGMRL